MRDGISGAALPAGFPYKSEIEISCWRNGFFPCVVGAIKINETGLGCGFDTETCISGDGGRGIMQLTSSYPSDWPTPRSNIEFAVAQFLLPAYTAWKDKLQGDDLVRAIAATYNAGFGNAQAGHDEGDLDKYTTNRYAERALAHYKALITGNIAGATE